MDSRGIGYLALLGIAILVGGVIGLYTLTKNYIINRRADKRKIVFKKKGNETKGYWRTKRGDEYDKDLKIDE